MYCPWFVPFFGLVLFALPADAADAKSRWLGDYNKAKALARQTGKPIFLVFR